jgi:co-chaperonin GroES (HSP10)
MAEVLAVGPGRRNKKGKLIPTQVKVGDRFPFFKGASETRQGHALAMLLDENEALLLESDVLFVAEEPVEVTL